MTAIGWMARVLGVSALIGIVPGVSILLAWRPRKSIGLIEFLGFSIGISFGLVQLLTVGALTVHASPVAVLLVFAGVVGIHAVAAFRSGDWLRVTVTRGELAVLVLAATLAVFLYASGSPFDNQEDRIHVSVIERLAYLDTPSVGNIYLSPGVVYTYPFPGTHYMMAMMSRVGGIEPLFLYHKLRAFWGVAAILLLYGCARIAFESVNIALATALVAIALVANGTFASVPGMYWAQLAPYSHASDVAMGVLLPALLLMAFASIAAETGREARCFGCGAVALAFMLTVVHPREVVQFLVYLTVFAAVLAVGRGPRPRLRRTAGLLVASAGVALLFLIARRFIGDNVDTLLAEKHEALRNLVTENSWGVLFGQPLPFLKDYLPEMEAFFQWWNPLVLIGGIATLYVLRARTLAWMMAASIAAYLLIVRVPLFAVTYAYASYFEILYTPVRNVIFFVHMLAGASLYLLAARLARRGYLVLCTTAVLISIGLIAVFRTAGPWFAAHPDALFLPLTAGYIVALIALRKPQPLDTREWIDRPPARWGLALGAMLLPIVAGTWQGSAVARMPISNAQPTPSALLAGLGCGDDAQFCPPSPALIKYMREQVPATAVLAVDARERYEPTMFIPQQVIVWTGTFEGLSNPRDLFPAYLKYFDRASAASLEQPLFNDRETRSEEVAFIRDLGVTHVLVNPRLHAMMSAVLGRAPDLFARRYDDGQWAVYQVTL